MTLAAGNFGPRPGEPQPPWTLSKLAASAPAACIERLGAQGIGRRTQPRAARQPGDRGAGVGDDLGAALAPALGDGQQHLPPRRHAVARLGRVVRAAVERDLRGREEDVQRPAALPGHDLDGLHVEGVDVGALLAVDLDADEVLVHERRGLGVLEALALHHVAPVAGRVADREEDRQVVDAGVLEGFRAPRAPVDRVAGVLQQVRGGLVRQRVGHRLSRPRAAAGSRTAGAPARAPTTGPRRPPCSRSPWLRPGDRRGCRERCRRRRSPGGRAPPAGR